MRENFINFIFIWNFLGCYFRLPCCLGKCSSGSRRSWWWRVSETFQQDKDLFSDHKIILTENTTLEASKFLFTLFTSIITRKCLNTKLWKLKRSLKSKSHTQSKFPWKSHTQLSSSKKFMLSQSTSIQFTHQNMFIMKITDMEVVMEVIKLNITEAVEMVNIDSFNDPLEFVKWG